MIKADIIDKELREKLNNVAKDEMAVFVMADGRIRGALFNGTHFINQMKAQHNTGILETYILGQGMLCGALLIPMMKGREKVLWKYEVNGPAKGFMIEADSAGTVHGFLTTDHIPIDKPLENWNMAPFLGDGIITMQRMQENDTQPFSSSVDVHDKNIAMDLATYFSMSQQINTGFSTSIQMDNIGRVIGAGGIFLQVMPETGGTKKIGAEVSSSSNWKDDEELLQRAEMALNAIPSLGGWFAEGNGLDNLINGMFREFEPTIAVRRAITFDCPCNKEHYLKYIKTLPKSEIDSIKNSGEKFIEVQCHNCSSIYKINVDEI